MKLAFSSYSPKTLTRSALCGVPFYRTETISSPTPTKKESLYKRISRVGDPNVCITPVINQRFNEEGHLVSKHEINSAIKNLRVSKRFNHALEISQWMNEWNHFALSPGDSAVRLGLIFKVHGIEQAEK